MLDTRPFFQVEEHSARVKGPGDEASIGVLSAGLRLSRTRQTLGKESGNFRRVGQSHVHTIKIVFFQVFAIVSMYPVSSGFEE